MSIRQKRLYCWHKTQNGINTIHIFIQTYVELYDDFVIAHWDSSITKLNFWLTSQTHFDRKDQILSTDVYRTLYDNTVLMTIICLSFYLPHLMTYLTMGKDPKDILLGKVTNYDHKQCYPRVHSHSMLLYRMILHISDRETRAITINANVDTVGNIPSEGARGSPRSRAIFDRLRSCCQKMYNCLASVHT